MKMKITVYLIIALSFLTAADTNSQVKNWQNIIKNTQTEVRYYSADKPSNFIVLENIKNEENRISFTKYYSDKALDLNLSFKNYESYIELSGEVLSEEKNDLCFTVKVIFPLKLKENKIRWSYNLDSSVNVKSGKNEYNNFIDANTVIPPDGAFNTGPNDNGGYGNKVGAGKISFYPLAAVSAGDKGYGWGIDMGTPVVFRLSYDPGAGMIAEFDLATSSKTIKFPNRTFFRLNLFEFDSQWSMRSALEKYYLIQPEYFKRRVGREGIWLPFTPLHTIKNFQDFGFAFHETSWPSKDPGLNNLPTITADKSASIYSFEYTEPWDIQLPIDNINMKYGELVGDSVIDKKVQAMLKTSASFDANGRWEARRLKTPWFKTGWAVSITTNADPDITGANRYNMVREEEINPALKLNADGIYFDSMEWNWHYDLNYNQEQFKYTDYPLTFSASLADPKPAIWNYASEYKMMKRIADEMHLKNNLVMGNGFAWTPFAPGVLDLFGSEFSWYMSADSTEKSLEFIRTISYQKPIVFLLNEGLDDKVFNEPPYGGYTTYFERMLFYGFFPSFFSVNSSSDPYWQDSVRYNIGRPFFKKYIPLIKEVAEAGWQPVTYARAANNEIRIERFGTNNDTVIYFTVLNPNNKKINVSINLDGVSLNIKKILSVEELVEGKQLNYSKVDSVVKLNLNLKGKSTRLIKIKKM